jgi:hypothetical protein
MYLGDREEATMSEVTFACGNACGAGDIPRALRLGKDKLKTTATEMVMHAIQKSRFMICIRGYLLQDR